MTNLLRLAVIEIKVDIGLSAPVKDNVLPIEQGTGWVVPLSCQEQILDFSDLTL
jgi:hypothetical protein